VLPQEPALDRLAINNSLETQLQCLRCPQINAVSGQDSETEGSQLSENPWNNQLDKINEATPLTRLKTLISKEYGLEAATSSIISGSQTSNSRSDDYLKPKTATGVETNWSVSDLLTRTDKDSKVPTTIHEEYTSGPLIMHKLDSLRQDLRMFFSKRNTRTRNQQSAGHPSF
jgi:hypothetical protein